LSTFISGNRNENNRKRQKQETESKEPIVDEPLHKKSQKNCKAEINNIYQEAKLISLNMSKQLIYLFGLAAPNILKK